jgi:excisionase family DNA binding protein
MPRKPSTPLAQRDWMTTPEVAEMFDRSTETVRDWIEQGKLHAYKDNGYFKVKKVEAVRRAKELYELESDGPEYHDPPEIA